MKLAANRYGKAKIRLLKKTRGAGGHALKQLEVTLLLTGDFEPAFTAGDNRSIVATDSLKNLVNLRAHERLGDDAEPFLTGLAEEILSRYAHVRGVTAESTERVWRPLSVAGNPHADNFLRSGDHVPTAAVEADRLGTTVKSGVCDLTVLKCGGSAFADFWRDDLATLPDTDDRLLATTLTAEWRYDQAPNSYGETNACALRAALDAFADAPSPSVQATLHAMGTAALEACPELAEITLTMPNLHCLPVDLRPFGVKNLNTLFVPTESPQGWIQGTVSRDGAGP